jgi:hypothetical protein
VFGSCAFAGILAGRLQTEMGQIIQDLEVGEMTKKLDGCLGYFEMAFKEKNGA